MAGNVIVITSHKQTEWDGGDSVITAGLLAMWPALRNQQLTFSADIRAADTEQCVKTADYIVHAGTPSWLTIDSRRFWKAAIKYSKHVSMLGIGLAVPYNSEMWYAAEDFVNLRDSRLIDLIVCRDRLCYYWLHQRLGFPAERISVLPCPGFFIAEPAPALDKKEVVLSIANVEETAHETRDTFQNYYEKTAYLAAELARGGANVRLMYQRRLGGAFRDELRRFFGDQTVHSFGTCNEFCDFIRTADIYIGVRNHGALPCAGAGKPSLLLGTDYRQALADEIPFLSKIDISYARWEPRQVLDWYHALEPCSVANSLVNYRAITLRRWHDALKILAHKIPDVPQN
jgi:hypothetical protein